MKKFIIFIKKTFNKNTILILVGLFLGAASTIVYQKMVFEYTKSKMEKMFSNQEDVMEYIEQIKSSDILKDFPAYNEFNSGASFEEMEKRLIKLIKDQQRFMDKFDAENREDFFESDSFVQIKNDNKSFYSFELNYKDFDQDEIRLDIKDNVLKFSGKKEQDEEPKYHKEFSYNFTIPEGFSSKNPEIKNTKGKIIVKFKKENLTK